MCFSISLYHITNKMFYCFQNQIIPFSPERIPLNTQDPGIKICMRKHSNGCIKRYSTVKVYLPFNLIFFLGFTLILSL